LLIYLRGVIAMENMLLKSEDILAISEKESTVYSNSSFCPSCLRAIPSKIVIREGFSYLIKKCTFENIEFESLLEKVNQPFRKNDNLKDRPCFSIEVGQKNITEADIFNFQDIQNIYLLLTSFCNSDCKMCFDKYSRPRGEMTFDFIKEKLKIFKNKQIYLSGGEPTLRDDLPEIIKLVTESGNIPVLLTNGLKLSDVAYLRRLKRNGLGFIYLSLDGLKEEIYERLRGGKFEYKLKLQALENIKKEKIRTVITTTLVKGINNDQVKGLIDYAKKHNFISEISFRPLYLGKNEYGTDFDKSHLLSKSEINELVCQALEFSNNYFELFYDMKSAAVKFLKKLFPDIKINLPQQNHLYLKRKNGKFRLLLIKEELETITKYLNEGRWSKLIKMKYLPLLACFVKNKSLPPKIEQDMFKMGVFRVSQGYVRPAQDAIIAEQINALVYDPTGIIAYFPD
jgi:MoaA/NifB/PqqE/SkfB family radical SAM enzyme